MENDLHEAYLSGLGLPIQMIYIEYSNLTRNNNDK